MKKKTHRFTLDVETNHSRREAELAVLTAFARRLPDDCVFKLRKTPQKPEPVRTVVTCVYCGRKYPDGTPTAKAEALTDHVKVCDKHPMKRAIDALAALVGSRDKAELNGMRDHIHLLPISRAEYAPMRDAIELLLETLP